MIWIVVILLGLIAVPLTVEAMRTPMSEDRQKAGPGKLALLSQGTTHYEWMGPERGPVAVCVHGLTTPSFVWRGMARGLALMGFRVLVYDLYGRGYSETVLGRQDAAFFVTQYNDLLMHENVTDPVTLLGYSMGGAIAAHIAASQPQRIKQLVLLAPAGMQELATGKLKATRDLPVIGDWLFLAVYPFLLRKGIKAEENMPGSVENIADLQRAETDRRGYFPAVLSSLRGVLRHPAEAEHRAIAAAGIPTLAVWGAQDDVIALSCKDVLGQWNPGALQSVIDDAGHGLTYTHTDQVLEAIRASRG
ncbi:alpha/beta fold hydrolase [Tateyamaria sp. SN6-1]|uniref:alpha/beta fold hydrolase n=1 Tax=Tateyamaria sp. SN6-1 TaxID=3092148 RepID=UPI0039F50D54